MKFLANRTYEGDVPRLTKWLYTTSGMFRDGMYQFVSLFLLTFVQFFALGDVEFEEYLQMYSVITIIIIILRIFDGLNDPIMGFIIEKCHFKTGKYRPWIFLGAITNSIVTICMFWITPSGWTFVAFFALFYFLWDVTFTMNDIAFWSVLPSLSTKEQVRANLTTLLSVFISIGTFAVGGIVPIFAGGNQGPVYRIVSLICSLLFVVSQIILVIFMKERKVDENIEKNDEKMKFKEIFTVIIKNDQLRASIFAILLYYTGASVLVSAGLNYFYFNFGYSSGGGYQTVFTVVYAAATLIAQCLYPLFVNKLKIRRMKLFTICSLTTIGAYLLLFSYVFYTDPNTFPLLCVFGFIAFFGQTLMSLILYIMIQDSIDYNEYKFNERRESATFSLRAFTAKIGSSLQQLFLFIFLSLSSLFAISNDIANLEKQFEGNHDVIVEQADILVSGIENWQLIVFQIGFTIVPLLLFLGAFLIVRFKYKIDEDSHQMMVNEIEKRTKGVNNE